MHLVFPALGEKLRVCDRLLFLITGYFHAQVGGRRFIPPARWSGLQVEK
ncbi:MAG: hypothetical protein DSM106950_44430 [Stigonema ocellatum SAG 48.90 = DSM 106950]|nr:hypothetical protein [Stigonema ocellatum SAG 48.90 = DSM 106950]